ncbi:MAG: hypothetical protein NC824_03755 [Candidatus Omnitrophica bacterium]|nr:hypothetical protein [Candidatus Omnitrophota bacterium]
MEKENLILKLMELSLEKNASDIHLQTGSHPALRIKGEIVRIEEFPVLDGELMKEIASFILKKEKRTTIPLRNREVLIHLLGFII